MNFLPRQMPHQRLVMAFRSDSVDPPRLCQCEWQQEPDISEKGFDCCEPSVTRGGAVTSMFLNVSEKVENQRGIDLFAPLRNRQVFAQEAGD